MNKLYIPMQLVEFIAEKESFNRLQVVFCKQLNHNSRYYIYTYHNLVLFKSHVVSIFS